METYGLGPMELRFAELIWEREPTDNRSFSSCPSRLLSPMTMAERIPACSGAALSRESANLLRSFRDPSRRCQTCPPTPSASVRSSCNRSFLSDNKDDCQIPLDSWDPRSPAASHAPAPRSREAGTHPHLPPAYI